MHLPENQWYIVLAGAELRRKPGEFLHSGIQDPGACALFLVLDGSGLRSA
jgi:hypothetical protein